MCVFENDEKCVVGTGLNANSSKRTDVCIPVLTYEPTQQLVVEFRNRCEAIKRDVCFASNRDIIPALQLRYT